VVGGEAYFGNYGTTVVDLTYSTVYQFSVGGGVTYRLGR